MIDRMRASRPTGILTDIDGTISPIAQSPELAEVDPRARAALARLTREFDLIAAVSGRSAEDAHRMVGLDSLVYSGNHGMEWWRNGKLEQSKLASEHAPRIRELLHRLERAISVDGVRFEDKTLTASVHVRETRNPEQAEIEIVELATELADELNLRVTRGRMVVEIRPPIELNKGSSVRDLVEAYGLASGIYIGDDVTDVDAFQVMKGLRERNRAHLYAIGVNSLETPAIVIEEADALVEGIPGVVDLLEYAAGLHGDRSGD